MRFLSTFMVLTLLSSSLILARESSLPPSKSQSPLNDQDLEDLRNYSGLDIQNSKNSQKIEKEEKLGAMSPSFTSILQRTPCTNQYI